MWRTSGRGRTQFSVEKPKTVSQPTPRAAAARTTSARVSSPAVCPSVRGSPRRLAHRPFPSMTHATWTFREGSRGEGKNGWSVMMRAHPSEEACRTTADPTPTEGQSVGESAP